MNEKWETIARLENILSRELDYLHEEIRAHHSSWDNHIITLAMAAIGFSFTVIPFSKVTYTCLLIFSLLCFVLSIAFALINYIFSDKSMKVALEGNKRRSNANINARVRLKDLENELSNLPPTELQAQELAKEKADKEIMEIYGSTQIDEEIAEIDNLNKTVWFLNHAKTYSFILGVFVITMFCVVNMSNFGG